MASRLLTALGQSRLRAFACPRSGLQLEARLPSRSEVRAARTSTSQAWGTRPIVTGIDVDEYQSFYRERLLAACVLCDGQPIGMEAVDQLDVATLRAYDAELSALQDEADPAVETWTDDEVSELVDGLKKKDTRIESLLRQSGPARLLALLRSMAEQLPT
jgi:hypothetical protein